MAIQWVVVYHHDDEHEYDYEGEGIPDHKDKTIKFIRRGEKHYVPNGTGWCPVSEERAERQRPYVPRTDIQTAVSSRFPRRY